MNLLTLLYIDHKTITRTLQICNIRRSIFLSSAEQLPYVNTNAQEAARDELLPNHAFAYTPLSHHGITSHIIGTFVTSLKQLRSRFTSCPIEKTRRRSLIGVSCITRKEVKINDHMDYRGISAECDLVPYLCGVFRWS